MKKIFFIAFTFIILSVNAQVKIGKNLTNQAPNSSFQVEGNTTNEQLVVFKNGQVAIGTVTPDPNAALDVSSTTKGFMPPRLTTAERTLIESPSSGMLIFNTTTGCVEIFNGVDSQWKALCGEDARGSSVFTTDCGTINIQGNYSVGVSLTETEFITVFVDVEVIGTYNIVANAGTMVFSATGEFTTTGLQQITLTGQGKPAVVGLNTLSIIIGDEVCIAMVNVISGVATVTSCHTGSPTFEYGYNYNAISPWPLGRIFPDDILEPSSVNPNNSLGVSIIGIAYSTPTAQVYSIQSPTVNGMSLYGPLNGTFQSATPAGLQFEIIGSPILAGNWVIPYKINAYGTTCNITVPVRSGTAYITSVSTSGISNSPQPISVPNNCYKEITYTIGTLNDGNTLFRTTTANGIYFEGYAYEETGGASKVIGLVSVGTPISTGTFTYTFQVSSSNTAFTSHSFTYTFVQPAEFPAIPTCTEIGTATTNQYIKPTNTGAYDNFGGTLTLNSTSGNPSVSSSLTDSAFTLGRTAKMSANGLTLVVGAPNEDSSDQSAPTNNSSANSGAVYVFHRANTSSNFTQQAYIKETSIGGALQPDNNFGASVDISDDGNRIVIGSPNRDDFATTNSGVAYIYSRSGSTWILTSTLQNTFNYSSQIGDKYGSAVAISGNGLVVAVGAPYEDTDYVGYNNNEDNQLKSNSGAVNVYGYNGIQYVLIDNMVKSDNIDAGDYFGSSIALNTDGTILVVGAPGEDGSGKGINPQYNNSASNAGAVYTFIRNGNNYDFQSYLKPNNTLASMYFGFSVDISSTNRLVVGAPHEGRNAANAADVLRSGAVYVYDRSGSTWTFNKRLKTNNVGVDDLFGWSVAVSEDGTTIFAGAPGEDSSITAVACADVPNNASLLNSGAIYSFGISGGSFVQGMLFKPITNGTLGASSSDYYGLNVSCNTTGTIIAYGTGYEDGSATTVNGTVNNSATSAGCVIVVNAP